MLQHWKKIATGAASLTAILGAYAAWQAAGLPTLAWASDVKTVHERIDAVEQFEKGTRAIVLNQEWERTFKELETLRARLLVDPNNHDLQARIRDKEADKRRVEQQLELLNSSQP